MLLVKTINPPESGKHNPSDGHDNFIRRLKNREKESFTLLYRLYAPSIYGCICRALNDDTCAKLVLEQTFTQAWCKISLIDENEISIFTWLRRLASVEINNVNPGLSRKVSNL